MNNEANEEQRKLYRQYLRSELRQNALLRVVTLLLMIVLGGLMASPYQNPENPTAQTIFYFASSAGFFFICYVLFRSMISTEVNARTLSAQRTFGVLVALTLVYLGVMESYGWFDRLISYLVSLSPAYLKKTAEVFGFVVLAAISGVIGNFTCHLLTKWLGNGNGK
jgi:hypothetical protein